MILCYFLPLFQILSSCSSWLYGRFIDLLASGCGVCSSLDSKPLSGGKDHWGFVCYKSWNTVTNRELTLSCYVTSHFHYIPSILLNEILHRWNVDIIFIFAIQFMEFFYLNLFLLWSQMWKLQGLVLNSMTSSLFATISALYWKACGIVQFTDRLS